MAMQFAIRIEHTWESWPTGIVWQFKWETWDTLKLAEQRATTLRKQGARVDIYKAL